MFLRFGMPQLTQEGDYLWFVTDYVLNNKKMVELFNGVLLPVCMLGLFELIIRVQDQGAVRLAEKCTESAATIAAGELDGTFDPFPLRMVMVSLMILSGWMLFIGIREPAGQTVLLSAAAVFFILGAATELYIRYQSHRSSNMTL